LRAHHSWKEIQALPYFPVPFDGIGPHEGKWIVPPIDPLPPIWAFIMADSGRGEESIAYGSKLSRGFYDTFFPKFFPNGALLVDFDRRLVQTHQQSNSLISFLEKDCPYNGFFTRAEAIQEFPEHARRSREIADYWRLGQAVLENIATYEVMVPFEEHCPAEYVLVAAHRGAEAAKILSSVFPIDHEW
jgi:hypothetical protein